MHKIGTHSCRVTKLLSSSVLRTSYRVPVADSSESHKVVSIGLRVQWARGTDRQLMRSRTKLDDSRRTESFRSYLLHGVVVRTGEQNVKRLHFSPVPHSQHGEAVNGGVTVDEYSRTPL